MIFGALIWNFSTILLVVIIASFALFWGGVMFRYWDYGMGEIDDEDSLDLPDEVTVEIVKEKPNSPAQSSVSQTELSAPLDSSQTPSSNGPSSRPKGKGVYLPE